MRPSLIAAGTATVLAFGGIATTAVAASATAAPSPQRAATCTVVPKFPKFLAFGRDDVTLKTPIAIKGPAICRTAADFDANASFGVKGNKSDNYFVLWLKQKGVDKTEFYASLLHPGPQTMWGKHCSIDDAKGHSYSCTIKSGSYDWKYKGRAGATVTRSGAKVSFTVHAKRYKAFDGYVGESTTVQIQRKAGKKWVLVHKGKTAKNGTLKFTYTHAAKATYRVTEAGTSLAFAATSPSITK